MTTTNVASHIDELAPRFADENLREGTVVECDKLTHDVDEIFDFVVIGSGAAGATAAYVLAGAGNKVAIVEEGPWIKTRDFGVDIYGAFRRMLREGGTQVLSGRTYIPMIQGRCVGGSTVTNSAIAWRTPEDVLADWSSRFGLGDAIGMRSLDTHFDALERELNAVPVADEILGESNRIFLEQGEKSGFAPTRMRRYERGCKGSGRCITGCPNGAKQGMSITYVPWSLGLGARIYTSCKADKVVVAGGRAVGVRGHAGSETGKRRVFLRAKQGVIVAASTVQTPNILRRSGIRSAALGEHFQAHPGVGIGGLFDRRVDMTFGASQGAEAAYFRSQGFKLETIAMQPELAAVRVPSIGRELVERVGDLSRVAVWAAQVRAEAHGTVRSGWGGADRVTYSLTERDVGVARKACATLARTMFEAGAKQVWVGVFGLPSSLTSIDQDRKSVV